MLVIPHTAARGHAPLVTSLVLLVVFGSVSIGLREWFVQRRRHAEGRDNPSLRDRLRELLSPVEEPTGETGAGASGGRHETGKPGGAGHQVVS